MKKLITIILFSFLFLMPQSFKAEELTWLDENMYITSYLYEENESKIYHISNAKELSGLAYAVNIENYDTSYKTFILDNDISLENALWIPINYFKGDFDGNNKTIKGININADIDLKDNYKNLLYKNTYDFGLFRFVSGSNIKNITIKGIINIFDELFINNETMVIGSLSGTIVKSNITNVNSYININSSKDIGSINKYIVGGIAGILYGINSETISSFEMNNNYGDIIVSGASNSEIGGLVGNIINERITKSINYGGIIVNGGSYENPEELIIIGGVNAYSKKSVIDNCTNFGNIKISNTSRIGIVGGLTGYSINGKLSHLFNYGNITTKEKDTSTFGHLSIGGLSGFINKGTLDNSSNKGYIVVDNNEKLVNVVNNKRINIDLINELNIGGLVGKSNNILITNAYNNGLINGSCIKNINIGGLCGSTSKTSLYNNYNAGLLTSNSKTNVAQIIGRINEPGELFNQNYYVNNDSSIGAYLCEEECFITDSYSIAVDEATLISGDILKDNKLELIKHFYKDEVIADFYTWNKNKNINDGYPFLGEYVEDKTSSGSIGISGTTESIPYNTKLSISTMTQDTKYKSLLSSISSKYIIYNIKLLNEDTEITPSGYVKVSFKIPAGYNKNFIELYHINDNKQLEEFDITIEGENAYFYTNHFSLYALIDANIEKSNDKTSLYILVMLGIIGVLFILLFDNIKVVYKKKKRKHKRDKDAKKINM